MGRKILFVALSLIPLAAGAAWLIGGRPTPDAGRYPELAGADPALTSALRGAWPEPRTFGLWSFHGSELERVLRGSGPAASVALLAILRDEYADHSFGFISYGPYFLDEEHEPLAVWIAARADDSLNPLLLRMAADRGLHPGLRMKAVIALCRPGNSAAAGPLGSLVVDPEERHHVRAQTLYRLSRLGAPLPTELNELLLPFHGHDALAAAALARTGDPAAPSLLFEGLRGRNDDSTLASLAEAVLAICPDDSEPARRAERLREACIGEYRPRTSERESEPGVGMAAQALSDALEDWLVVHPELQDSEFERRRRACRKSERRRREESVRSFVVPPSCAP